MKETIWKRKKAREEYKIIYTWNASTRNDVGVIGDIEIKGKEVEMVGKNDYVLIWVILVKKRITG